jgi:hypothetical protein
LERGLIRAVEATEHPATRYCAEHAGEWTTDEAYADRESPANQPRINRESTTTRAAIETVRGKCDENQNSKDVRVDSPRFPETREFTKQA